MESHEVIIVGGGPAGSACAKALGDAGVDDVVVLEQESPPRNKICSGILFGQTQQLLPRFFSAMPPAEVYCEPRIIDAENILEWSRDGGFMQYVWELDKDGNPFPTAYHNIWRSAFDRWLLEQSGAMVKDQRMVRGYGQQGQEILLDVLQRGDNKSEVQMRCRFLVGADGGNSRIRMTLDPTWRQTGQEVFIYQTYNRFFDMGELKDAHWYVFFEPSIGEILSCAHRKDEFLTLCVGGSKGRNLKESMAGFRSFLKDTFGVALDDEVRFEGCVMRQAPPQLGFGNVLLAGDAAGLIYLNGEGISAAIDSGYRAGRAIAGSIEDGKPALTRYQENMQDILAHMQRCLEQMHFMCA